MPNDTPNSLLPTIKCSQHCKCKELNITCKCDEECYIIDGRSNTKCPLCAEPLYTADSQSIHLTLCLSRHYTYDFCYQCPDGIQVNTRYFTSDKDKDIFALLQNKGDEFVRFLATSTDEELSNIRTNYNLTKE